MPPLLSLSLHIYVLILEPLLLLFLGERSARVSWLLSSDCRLASVVGLFSSLGLISTFSLQQDELTMMKRKARLQQSASLLEMNMAQPEISAV